jgi:phosphatidylinositol glycan class B
MTVVNPWQWYCSTRTFSNSVESTLTVMALYFWPWAIMGDSERGQNNLLGRSKSVNK